MSDQAFLHMVIERAQNVAALQQKGKTFKAATERNALNRDINFYCRANHAALAMYEKILMYYMDEKPAVVAACAPKRKNTKLQKRKERYG